MFWSLKKTPELSILQGSRFCSLSHTWINYSTTSHDTILEQITFLRLFRKMNKTLQDQQIGIQLDQAKPFFRTHQKSTNGWLLSLVPFTYIIEFRTAPTSFETTLSQTSSITSIGL